MVEIGSIEASDGSGAEFLDRIILVVDVLVRVLPGSHKPLLYMAQIKFFGKDYSASLFRANKSLAKLQCASSHLQLAEIYTHMKAADDGLAALDGALSLDFKIRNHVRYWVVKGLCLRLKNEDAESLAVFESALKIESVATFVSGSTSRDITKPRSLEQLSLGIQVATIYIELMSLQIKLNLTADSIATMSAAMAVFKGTFHEQRFAFSNVDLCLSMNEIDKAIHILNNFTGSQGYN